MKKRITIALILGLLLSLMLTVFTACGKDDTSDAGDAPSTPSTEKKQVPIYQGMTVENETTASAATEILYGDKDDVDYSGNNGNHNGHFKGDYAGKDEDIDSDDPYPDSDGSIEEEIKSSLTVVGSLEDIYYANRNENVYIKIHILNPDSYEILSFTLNGKKYSGYMFEEGSDMQTIILKYNVGDASGITDYTIDAIKYIDGEDIKDVIIDGDKTVRVGVNTGATVTATTLSPTITTDSASFTIDIGDKSALVAGSGGALKIMLYDGSAIVAERDLSVGSNSVAFDGLSPNKLYQYAVVAYYDDFSGAGFGMNVLAKNAFYTNSIVLFDNIEISKSGISFSVFKNPGVDGVSITALKLYKDGALMSELAHDTAAIDGLLSNNTYILRADYSYGSNTDSIALQFTTATMQTPEVFISSTAVGKDTLQFSVSAIDPDSVGEVTLVELLHASGSTVLDGESYFNAKNLLSDNDYTLRVTYTYDLFDGVGNRKMVTELSARTAANTVPDLSFEITEKNENSISFSVVETDPDGVGGVAKIEIYDATGKLISATPTGARFTNLLSGTAYTLKITYTYDLNDGTGEKSIEKTAGAKTDPLSAPSITFDAIVSNATSVSFGINEVDTDGVGEIVKLELLLGDDVIRTTTDGTVRSFDGLRSNTEYTIRLTYSYNLRDGSADAVIVKTADVATSEMNVPTLLISGNTQTTTSIGFAVEESDSSNVGEITLIELFRNEVLIKSSADVDLREFTGLMSNTEYTVRVTYVYDLNDGDGKQTITKETTIKTFAMAKPSIIFESTDRTKTSVIFDFAVFDVDGVGKVERIELIKDGAVVNYTTDPEATEFVGTFSNTTYTVKVIYSYDLNEGGGTEYLEKTVDITTYAKNTPEISIGTPTKTENSVGFSVTEIDEDGIGAITKIELLNKYGTITADGIDVREFTGLLSDNDYTVKVTYVYNLNDGTGNKTVIEELTVKTLAKATPSVTIRSTATTKDSLYFSVSVTDTDSVGAIAKIELLHKSGTVAAESTSAREFTGLLSDNDYTVRVTYVYNLNDGTGNKTIVEEFSVKTLAKATPTVEINNTATEQESLNFSVNLTDTDSVGAITKVEMLHGASVTVLEGKSSFEIKNLLSNNTYTLRVTYTYDLNDGEGIHTATEELSATTLAKTPPVISLSVPTSTQTSVSFTVTEADKDNVGAITKIELLHESGTVTAESTSAREFTGLLSDNDYTVKITYVYNLNDGTGNKTTVKELSVKTLAKATPTVEITNTASEQESLSFSVNLTDTDSVGTITKAELLHGSDVTVLEDKSSFEIKNLLSNNTYTLRVTYTYDLNDGTGAKTIVKELSATTRAKATPEISLSAPTSTKTSVGFAFNEADEDNVGAITKIELLHESGTVMAESTSAREFTGLLSDNDYTVKITYVYNLNDGTGNKTTVKELSVKTLAKATPTVEINNTASEQESLKFSVNLTDTDSVGTITKVEMLHGADVTVLEGTSSFDIKNLLSNNAYTLRVTYTYDLNDGKGIHTETEELSATTLTKATPTVEIINTATEQESLKFSVNVTDTDSVGAITKVEMLHGSDAAVLETATEYELKHLLTNNAYTLRVTYTYDLNDGEGAHTFTEELTSTTLAKVTPSINITDKNVETHSVEADYVLNDPDSTLLDLNVELYQGSTLIACNVDNELSFSSLTSYTDYTVRFTYTYDLGDGLCERTATLDYSFKTLPFIDVVECSIANTSAVSEGDTIYMSVKLNNPEGMEIKSVVINGEAYETTSGSTKNKIFVEIVYNGQFGGGDTYLKIDEVNATLDGKKYLIAPETELSDNVFINGRIELLKAEIVGADFKPIDWVFPSESLYLLLTFDNPTGYDISNVNGSVEVTKLDNNRWYTSLRETCGNGGWVAYTIESLVYSNQHLGDKTLNTFVESNYAMSLASDEIKYVSSPEDLLAMHEYYYYELTRDIDLAGIEWQGNAFDGVFDGKGYSIKNISFVGTFKDASAKLGLFSTGNGVIKDLTLEEVTIIADVISDMNVKYSMSAGAFIAEAYYVILDGCEIDEYSVISLRNPTSPENTYAGGFLGTYNYGVIRNCTNNANVTAPYAGGFAGYVYSNITVSNSINNGKISATTYGGGFFGTGHNVTNSDKQFFIDSVNNGDVTAYNRAGGFMGFVGIYTSFTNCTNNGTVASEFASGFVASASAMVSIVECVNNGDVNGVSYAGGFIGDNYGSLNLRSSINHGSISGSCHVGGLVGSLNSMYVTDVFAIYDCINYGTVTGILGSTTLLVGGILGSSQCPISIVGCENRGRVQSYRDWVGSILGYFDEGFTEYSIIKDCVNLGYITLDDYQSDRLVGTASTPPIESSYDLSVIEDYDGKDHTYTFVTGCDIVIDPITTKYTVDMPEISRPGYLFAGWYDNSNFLGDPLDWTYYSASDITLYAKWTNIDDFLEDALGTEVTVITLNDTVTSFIEENSGIYIKFIAPEDSVYLFTITGGDSYDILLGELISSDFSERLITFSKLESASYELKTGEMIYIGISFFGSVSGSVTLTVTSA